MTRPPQRSAPDFGSLPPARRRPRRGARLTVSVTVLAASAAGITVGAAAYARNANADTPVVAAPGTVAADELTGTTTSVDMSPEAIAALATLLRSDEEDRSRASAISAAEQRGGTEVIPGLAVKVGRIQVDTDRSGIPTASLPLFVTNTGELTRSFDITVVARNDKGKEITKDTGTAADLRPGQSAEVRVLQIVDNGFVEKLTAATFQVDDVYAY
ncbi:MAG: hypothetical protein ACT4P1_14345 [Sporichthyaceae bacterium]